MTCRDLKVTKDSFAPLGGTADGWRAAMASRIPEAAVANHGIEGIEHEKPATRPAV